MAQVIDLFCGIGGLTHGLQLAGLKVVAGFDIDPTCKYAYEKNNKTKFIEADVSELSAEAIATHYSENGIRILVGCAPCQPFSKYTMRYRKGEVRSEDNKDYGKWTLVESFAQKIKEILPEIISMENVPELANTDVFKNFLDTLVRLGYNVNLGIVFCPDYGVPQSRKRLVLLASTLGEISLIPPLFTPDMYKTVKQAIGGMPEIKSGERHQEDNLHYCSELSEINIKRIQASTERGTWRDWDESLQLECHKKDTGKSYPSVYGRMSWGSPSPTITTQFYGYGNGRFGHPEQDRALSIREGAILQSFPPDYKLLDEDSIVSTRILGKHIGNAVPVELGRAIGISIISHIREVDANDANNG